MGTYIKGVNLPELSDYSKINSTPEVYSLHGTIVVYPNGKIELKSYSGIFEGTYDVISVPPHGDLIDRDKVGLTDFEIMMCNGDYKEGMIMLLEQIDLLPTIMPAEEGER